ncbi:hypothetical protein [Streptosporangium sp. NPDC000396]|uniref:hypothetical protein n=1 Tax=Streptosporangium sp. NPDC000396 TaxID=3366185 RepID=UPI0036C28595
MTMLTYTVLTDPAPLEASAAGRPSTGTVYLLVTNTGQQAAYWSTTTVTVPIGNGTGDLTLTSNFNKIKTKGEYVPRPGTPPGTRPSVNVQRQGSNAVQATAPGGPIHFRPGDYMVLTLENVTVAAKPGLAVLTVTENAGRTKPKPGSLPPSSMAAVALVKTTPKELPTPRDFRPDKAMVDAGDKLTLHWEEIAGFGYEITYPGAPQPVPVSGGSWSPPAPKRATTYILTATGPNKQQHFLTTTVQVRNPELETLTATTEIKTPRVQGTATNWGLTITGTGAEISNGSGGKGPLTAGRAVFNGVLTEYVEGPNSGEGVITFPQGGVKIWRTGGSDDLGTLEASGVLAGWVEGPNSGEGVITFPQGGVKVWGAGGSSDPGILYADGVAATYVKGLNPGEGDITFAQGGVRVWRNRDSNDAGTLYAGKVNGVASGRSTPSYGWRPTGWNSFDIDVDTSAAGFTKSPIYLVSFEGGGGMHHDLRISGVYNVTATSFSVYLICRDDMPLTLAEAERNGWHINWVGYETP